MLTLALDTSQIRGSVVLFESPSRILSDGAGSTSIVHSEGLLSLIHQVLERGEKTLDEVACLACGVGPGSFTGIRVGMATMKAFAQVQNKPLVGFSSLRALALSYSKTHDCVVPVVNAYQQSMFIGSFEGADAQNASGRWVDRSIGPSQLSSLKFSTTPVFVGSGTKVFRSALSQAFPGAECHDLEVEPIGIVRAFAEVPKDTSSYLDVHANYIRLSAAEAKLDNSERN